MEKFKINKNSHYSNFKGIKFHFGKLSYRKQVIMHESCYYDYLNNNSFDINKLCGLSHGNHLENSIRFGWLPNFKKKENIEIYSYIHNVGIIHYNKICDVTVNTLVDLSWHYENENVIFSVFDGKIKYKEKTSFILPKFKWGYYLNPYFGGNNTAPKDISIIMVN